MLVVGLIGCAIGSLYDVFSSSYNECEYTAGESLSNTPWLVSEEVKLCFSKLETVYEGVGKDTFEQLLLRSVMALYCVYLARFLFISSSHFASIPPTIHFWFSPPSLPRSQYLFLPARMLRNTSAHWGFSGYITAGLFSVPPSIILKPWGGWRLLSQVQLAGIFSQTP